MLANEYGVFLRQSPKNTLSPEPMSSPKKTTENQAYKIRSICFDDDLLDAIEEQRLRLRMSRSELVRAVLEAHFGILDHPELTSSKGTTKPLTRGTRGPSSTLAKPKK